MTTEEPNKINPNADVAEGQDPGNTPEEGEPGTVGDATVGVAGTPEALPVGDAQQPGDAPNWEDSDDDLDDSGDEEVDPNADDNVVLGEAVDE